MCKPRFIQDVYYSGAFPPPKPSPTVILSVSTSAPLTNRTRPTTTPATAYYKGHGVKLHGSMGPTGLFEDFYGPR